MDADDLEPHGPDHVISLAVSVLMSGLRLDEHVAFRRLLALAEATDQSVLDAAVWVVRNHAAP